jgi:hypothetical protein
VLAVAQLGCTTSAPSPPAADLDHDAGAPPSAYASCDPAAKHDAAAFTYTATCTPAATEAGPPSTCSEWSESADGDWTPFADSCAAGGGTISTVPCAPAATDAGDEDGVCFLPAGCTTQTTLFYYGSAAVAAGRNGCTANGGAFTP